MNVTKELKAGLLKALDNKRIKGKQDDCYGWNGAPCKRGFARIVYKNRAILAHRAAWMAHFGKIPEFNFVRHSCGNKMCTNPGHLFLSVNKGPRVKHPDRPSGRIRRERLGIDLPSRLVWGVRKAAKKRNITMTKYMYILITRALEIEQQYEK